MYLGFVVETAPKEMLYKNPMHPYTEALLSAVPIPDPTYHKERIILEGDIPSTINLPKGCPFAPRCPYARAICAAELPDFVSVGERHQTRCFLQYEDAPADAHNPFKQDKIKE